MNKKHYIVEWFVDYICETWKNKLAVLVMLAIGVIANKILNDATFLVFIAVFMGPIFFIGKDCFR